MSNDLRLGLHPGGNDLYLGYTGAPDNGVLLLARTSAPRALFRAATARTVLTARTKGPTAVLRAAYDPNLLSDTVRATTGRWAGAGRQHHGCLSVQTDARPLPQEAACRWQEGRRVPGGAVAAWAGAEPAAGENEAAWRVATMECGTTGSAWAGAGGRRYSRASPCHLVARSASGGSTGIAAAQGRRARAIECP